MQCVEQQRRPPFYPPPSFLSASARKKKRRLTKASSDEEEAEKMVMADGKIAPKAGEKKSLVGNNVVVHPWDIGAALETIFKVSSMANSFGKCPC